MSDSDLRVGFLYENYELDSLKYQAAAIDFWQTSNVKDFDCGAFQALEDALHLAQSYGVSLPQEIAHKMSSTERANPCGLENAFFLLRERILSISNSSAEYLIATSNHNSLLDEFTKIQFNWIDDYSAYLNWLRFLSSEGEAVQEAGRIQQRLPSSFEVTFTNGFAGLGKQFPISLAIYSKNQTNFVAIGVTLILVGLLSLGLALTNIMGMRRINKFKHA